MFYLVIVSDGKVKMRQIRENYHLFWYINPNPQRNNGNGVT